MTDHTDSTQIVSSWLYNKRDQAQYVMQDGKIMGFTYNSAGEMTTIRYSAGNTMEIEGAVRTVAYDYDELGRLTAVKSGVVDTSNASLDTTNVKTVKDYTYAANGDLTTSREYMEFDTKADLQGVSLVQSYAYDAVGRPTEVAYKQGEAVKEKYTQSYDGRNYITQDSYTDGYGSTAKTLNRTYQYDAIGRLTETDVTNGEKTKTTGYQYDKVGNRLYQTVADGTKTVSTKYTYNALGQLTKTQKGLGQAQNVANWYNEEIYTYDSYGNRTGTEVYEVNEGITGSEKSGDVRYSYDESNQMVKYETKGTEEESWTEKARNVYNGEGMRVRQYEDGNSWARQYFYIGGALSISTDGSNENFVKSENILTPDGTILAALREAKAGEEIEGNAYWIYHYDARGSATNLVGAKNGSLYRAEENIYDAFGNEEKEIKQSTSSVVNDIKFTGATLDNSGTYYLGSRHYDPNTGRFLQQDTFKGEVYSPWTQNLYTYTSNNPVNYVDPTGHTFEELLGNLGRLLGVEDEWRKGGKKLDAYVDTLKKSTSTETSNKGGNGLQQERRKQKMAIAKEADKINHMYEIGNITLVFDDGAFVSSGPFRGGPGGIDVRQIYAKLKEMGYDPRDPNTPNYRYFFDHTHDKQDHNMTYAVQTPVNLGLLDPDVKTQKKILLWSSGKDATVIGNRRFGSGNREGELIGYSALLLLPNRNGKKEWYVEEFSLPYKSGDPIDRRWLNEY